MSLIERCNEIRELQYSDEDLAFEKLSEVLEEYKQEYTCDNVFYLHVVDENNNYKIFREQTKIIFSLIYDIFYDEEQLNEASRDPSVRDELTKYMKFLDSIKFIQMNIMDVPFENAGAIQVQCFYKHINSCNTFLKEFYEGIQELNAEMDKLNDGLDDLADRLVAKIR
jgi:hypothetical protein